jgi:MFS superfamily sulfate permease-like transporter
MVVSALIFVLGIDLVKEALWDTRHRVSKPEFITIASIMVAMTVWDFVIGVIFGIVVSCEHLLSGFDARILILTPRRHFLRRAELTATQHSCHAHRRNSVVYGAAA